MASSAAFAGRGACSGGVVAAPEGNEDTVCAVEEAGGEPEVGLVHPAQTAQRAIVAARIIARDENRIRAVIGL